MTDRESLGTALRTIDPHTDFERLGKAVDEFAAVMVETFRPSLEAAVETLNGRMEWLPGRVFRKERKRRQIRAHRTRVAARVPAWKKEDLLSSNDTRPEST